MHSSYDRYSLSRQQNQHSNYWAVSLFLLDYEISWYLLALIQLNLRIALWRQKLILVGPCFYIPFGEQKGHARNRIPNITNDPTIDIIIISWPKLKIFSVWKWEFLIPKVLYTNSKFHAVWTMSKLGIQFFEHFSFKTGFLTVISDHWSPNFDPYSNVIHHMAPYFISFCSL